MKQILLVIFCLTFLSGCTNNYGYNQLKDYDVDISKIGYATSIEILESKESGIIIFSKPSCEYCQSYIPKLVQAVDSCEIDKVFYVDSSEMTEEEKDDYLNYFPVKKVPVTYFIDEGRIRNQIIGDADQAQLEIIIREEGLCGE
jgi:thiol-disulfide isomerase/thioredoxin